MFLSNIEDSLYAGDERKMSKKTIERRRLNLFFIFVISVIVIVGWCFTVDAKTKWKNISTKAISHIWYNYSWYYSTPGDRQYALAYKTTFKKNGTVVQKGYRNKDLGKYKISKDGKKVIATYNKCYYDYPGYGFKKIKGYKYTVTYRMKDKHTLYAKYSKKATETNAGSGYLYR